MKDLSFFSRIFIAVRPVDFRKQAHGLAVIVDEQLGEKSTRSRAVYAFTNRRKNAVKCLYWDETGYAMWWKNLEKDRFRWPKNEDEVLEISAREMKWLLEGVDISKLKKHDRVLPVN